MKEVERKNDSLRRCFVIAPLGAESTRVVEALTNRGIHCFQPNSLLKSEDVSKEILDSLADADFVVAVFQGAVSPNLAFELGVAHAYRKPTLVFTSNYDATFDRLYHTHTVKVSSNYIQDLGQNIDRFLRHSRYEAKEDTESKAEPLAQNFDWARDRLAQLKRERVSTRGLAFEQLILQVFQQAGVQGIEVKPGTDIGADLVVWQNDIAYVLGGSLIIECKMLGESTANIASKTERTIERLERLVAATDAPLALLIFDRDLTETVFTGISTFNVLVFGARQIIALLEQGAFASEVLQRRQQAAYRTRVGV